MSLASLKLVAEVGQRQGFEAHSVNQVRGNKNPKKPKVRWFLGTAIKSWQRAAPYPATHEQEYAAPKSEGFPEKKEENAAFGTGPLPALLLDVGPLPN